MYVIFTQNKIVFNYSFLIKIVFFLVTYQFVCSFEQKSCKKINKEKFCFSVFVTEKMKKKFSKIWKKFKVCRSQIISRINGCTPTTVNILYELNLSSLYKFNVQYFEFGFEGERCYEEMAMESLRILNDDKRLFRCINIMQIFSLRRKLASSN